MNKPKNTSSVATTPAPQSKPAVATEQAPPTEAPVAIAPRVKVQFLRAHRAFAYAIGEETEISREDFDKYSQDGPYFKQL